MANRLTIMSLCMALLGAFHVCEKGYAAVHAYHGGGKTMTGEQLMHMVENSNYQDWRLWPGTRELHEEASPHGAHLTTYVNDTAYKVIKNKSGPLPYGSIIVKENYTDGKKLAAVTVMYKTKGFDADSGDWYYLKYSPQKQVQASGDVESCKKCHAKVKDNDYLFTSSVK